MQAYQQQLANARHKFAQRNCCCLHGPPLLPTDEDGIAFFRRLNVSCGMKSTVALELRVMTEPSPGNIELSWAPEMAVLGAATDTEVICIQGVPHMLRRIVRNANVHKLIRGPDFYVGVPYNVEPSSFTEVLRQNDALHEEVQCVACAAENILGQYKSDQEDIDSEWCDVLDSELAF